MKRVAVWVLILLLMAVGILLAFVGILVLSAMSSETDSDYAILDWIVGWIGLLVGILCCLGSGLVAAFCRPWRSQQASGPGAAGEEGAMMRMTEAGKRDGTIMQKSLIGALVGLFAGPALVSLVVAAIYLPTISAGEGGGSVALLYCPIGAVPGLVLGALTGAAIGKVMDSRRRR